MQILLANAKIMFEKADRKPISVPLFQSVANDLAKEMAMMNVEELAKQLDCSSKIAMTNWKRYHDFMAAEKMPAILAYNGQAYKHLRASSLSEESLEYAQKHLWITCFLYGLLRPLDGIVPYRSSHLDGAVSEKIIKGGHSIQETPEAVLELRRILKLHLIDHGLYKP